MRSSPSRRPELERLGALPFAHRGLHGGGRVENGAAAIAAAVDSGYGVELDVQLSRDGEAMVFHDYELDRLTLGRGPVAARTAAEL
jgi:glycerophosphoryl diester phosphodiesterase